MVRDAFVSSDRKCPGAAMVASAKKGGTVLAYLVLKATNRKVNEERKGREGMQEGKNTQVDGGRNAKRIRRQRMRGGGKGAWADIQRDKD